ncbi:MAG TPA: response regulator [Candidatus Cloacimonadota bacterium]|jgi:two-component system response regulator YesN|nr:response regulator [Candidatus Cloacimonadota bacterium]
MISSEKTKLFPILFVDDDPLAHKLIESSFKDWKVFYAFSAEDALKLLEKENIQIVISDINMPGMSGIQFLEVIKKRYGTIQVIMITAEDEIENLINALSMGANDFLIKPVNKTQLEDALMNTIDKISRWKVAMKDLFNKARNKD